MWVWGGSAEERLVGRLGERRTRYMRFGLHEADGSGMEPRYRFVGQPLSACFQGSSLGIVELFQG